MGHFPGHHIIHGIGPGTAMGVHHTLRLPSGTRSVVEGDRIPFIVRETVIKLGISLGQQRVIGQRTNALPTRPFGVLNIDNQQVSSRSLHCLFCQLGVLGVDQQHLGFPVIKDVAQRLGVQSHIIGIEYRPQHGNGQRALQCLRYIGRDQRDGVALAHPPL